MSLTRKEIAQELKVIDEINQLDMAHLWRFAPVGHKYFDKTLPFFDSFGKRFKALGGFTPAISKQLGR